MPWSPGSTTGTVDTTPRESCRPRGDVGDHEDAGFRLTRVPHSLTSRQAEGAVQYRIRHLGEAESIAESEGTHVQEGDIHVDG